MTRVHLSLKTADLAATMRFYTELFGAGPDKTRPDYARFQPADVPLALALMPGEPTQGAHHFGVKLGSVAEVIAARTRLEAAGLVDAVEEAVTCCHAVQDKIWAHDPDGRAWEVYTVTDDQTSVARDPEMACCNDSAASCCP